MVQGHDGALGFSPPVLPPERHSIWSSPSAATAAAQLVFDPIHQRCLGCELRLASAGLVSPGNASTACRRGRRSARQPPPQTQARRPPNRDASRPSTAPCNAASVTPPLACGPPPMASRHRPCRPCTPLQHPHGFHAQRQRYDEGPKCVRAIPRRSATKGRTASRTRLPVPGHFRGGPSCRPLRN